MAFQAVCTTINVIITELETLLELYPCKFLKVKNVSKWNPSELAICVKPNNSRNEPIALQWNTEITVYNLQKLKISSSISCSYTWTYTCRVSQSVSILGLQLNETTRSHHKLEHKSWMVVICFY